MPHCVECGEPVDADHAFCPNCGREVGTGPADDGGEGSDRSTANGDRSAANDDQAASGGRSVESDDAERDPGGAVTDDAPATWGSVGTAGGAASAGSERSSADEGTTAAGRSAESGDAESADGDDAGSVGGEHTGSIDGSATGSADGKDIGESAREDESRATSPDGESGATEPVDRSTDVDGASPFSTGAFAFAAGYAFREDYDPIVVGSLFELVGWMVFFPLLLVRGYGFRLLAAAARGQSRPPEFDDYGDLFADGLRFLAVALAWSVALLALGGGSVAVAWFVDEALAWVAGAGALLAYSFVLPASLTAYAAHDDVGCAFSPRYAGAFAFTTTYLKAFASWAVIGLFLAVLALVSLVTVVGVVVVLTWSVYLFCSFWGYYYRRAVAVGENVPPARAESV